MKRILIFFLPVLIAAGIDGHSQSRIYLHELNLKLGTSGWKTPQINTNIDGSPLSLNNVVYKNGVGVHATSSIAIATNARLDSLYAVVGIDSKRENADPAYPVFFIVSGDGMTLFKSPPMTGKSKAQPIAVSLKGIYNLDLRVEMAGHRNNGTYANWCDAYFTARERFIPDVMDAYGKTDIPKEEITQASDTARKIISYEIPAKPILNTPSVIGSGPAKNFRYYVAVSGDEPKKIAITGLPAGLRFDEKTRLISGISPAKGDFPFLITASNSKGKSSKTITLKIGDNISLTPPMGWNSWNAFGPAINQENILNTAKALKNSGLADFGWSYINIDDGWQGPRDSATATITAGSNFPDIEKLTKEIHELGLQVGIYSTPWATSYMNLTGGSGDLANGKTFYQRRSFGVYSFHEHDAKAYAKWGIDYLKYDWAKDHYPYTKAMKEALMKQDRNIVLSISSAVRLDESRSISESAELWRVNGDIEDNWKSVYSRAFYHTRWAAFQKPGHWADPDMLVVGKVSWGKPPHPSHLTPWEQVSHIGLWALFSSPMILGCDLTALDPFTKALLTNSEIIEINQDALGQIAEPILADYKTGKHIFRKVLSDGSVVVGFFNTSGNRMAFPLEWKSYKPSFHSVTDVWMKKDWSLKTKELVLEPHASKIFRIR